MKSVVVASGKGGTGKTTLTAVFAHLSARTHEVAVADGDVEASNLPLALRAYDASCTEFPGIPKVSILGERCTECGLCAEVCRFDAIVVEPSGAYRVDPLACEGCGRCVTVCPSDAIVTSPASAGEACLGRSDFGPLAFGQLGPGEDLSGKLVTEVRRLGRDAADQHQSDVLLIDGPPGTGCPLIAAVASTDMVVAVAEPTISGEHDLDRLAAVAARLDLPVRVVLNKADLSEHGAQRVRELCASRGLPVLVEVPFDRALASTLEMLAQGVEIDVPKDSAGWVAAAEAWKMIESELGL
jgi:MinD superfamily P-loop ATPase